MSSILKALKKLEGDNATRWPGDLKIDSEIVRSDNPSRLSPSVLLLTSLLLLAGGSGVMIMYMKRVNTPESSHLMPRQSTPQVSVPDIKTEQLPEALVVVPARQLKTEKIDPLPKQHQPTMPTVQAPATFFKPVKSIVAAKPADTTQHQTYNSPPQPVPASKAVPELRVNGIAYQAGGAESVAMINGEPFSNGAVINGAKIEDIHENRVRFSYNGELFEIQLGQSNR